MVEKTESYESTVKMSDSAINAHNFQEVPKRQPALSGKIEGDIGEALNSRANWELIQGIVFTLQGHNVSNQYT